MVSGVVLSALVFILVLNYALSGIDKGGTKICDNAYADDISIVARSQRNIVETFFEIGK